MSPFSHLLALSDPRFLINITSTVFHLDTLYFYSMQTIGCKNQRTAQERDFHWYYGKLIFYPTLITTDLLLFSPLPCTKHIFHSLSIASLRSNSLFSPVTHLRHAHHISSSNYPFPWHKLYGCQHRLPAPVFLPIMLTWLPPSEILQSCLISLLTWDFDPHIFTTHFPGSLTNPLYISAKADAASVSC